MAATKTAKKSSKSVKSVVTSTETETPVVAVTTTATAIETPVAAATLIPPPVEKALLTQSTVEDIRARRVGSDDIHNISRTLKFWDFQNDVEIEKIGKEIAAKLEFAVIQRGKGKHREAAKLSEEVLDILCVNSHISRIRMVGVRDQKERTLGNMVKWYARHCHMVADKIEECKAAEEAGEPTPIFEDVAISA